jgi:hypothetical protein
MTDKLKITFAPGCFDSFDGTQEELDAMIAEVTKMFEDNDFSNDKIVYLGENDLTEEEWDILDEQDAKYMSETRTIQ